jgi:predicted NBD/HSP70 family sugar kinase
MSREGVDHEPFDRRGRSRRKAGPGDARRHNRALVLRTIFRQGPLSRADLARVTHLTRVTTSDLAAELLAEGLIEELGTRVGQRIGKPATLLGVVADARLTVTLDLSDDERFRAALVDLAGKVRDRRTAERDGRTGAAAVELAVALAVELAEAADRPLLGVGIGSPGVVDATGHVLEAPNRGWHDLDLAGEVRRAVDVPVHVANDANAVALAVHAAAGEPDGSVVEPGGEPCTCGRRGCLETAVAAPRLRGRDDAARAAAGRLLGEALAPVISTLNLREVVLSGPLDVLDETFRSAALDAVRDRTMPAVGENADIRFSSLGEDDVLLGAAMLVLDRELGVA